MFLTVYVTAMLASWRMLEITLDDMLPSIADFILREVIPNSSF